MKSHPLILTAVVLLFSSLEIYGQAPTDWQRKGLKGRVKFLIERTSAQIGMGEMPGFIPSNDKRKFITEFNENGYIERSFEIDRNGRMLKKMIFEYDDSGYKKKVYHSYLKDFDTVRTTSVYEFSKHGRSSTISTFSENGKLANRSLISYDTIGRITRVLFYAPPDSIFSRTDYEYEGDIMVGFKSQTRLDKYPMQSRVAVEEMDSRGNWIKISIHYLRNASGFESQSREIEYFDN